MLGVEVALGALLVGEGDVDGKFDALQLEYTRQDTAGEITLFIKHTVIEQLMLVIGREDLAIAQH